MRLAATLALAAGFSTAAPAGAGDVVARAGDVGEVALPAAALLAVVLHQDGEGAKDFAQAYLSTLAVVYSLKLSVDRRRPDGGRHSFPSGHTASAAAGAAFLQHRYGWRYGLPGYAAASFVGYSRLHARRHFASDVLVGGALGIGASALFTRRHRTVAVSPVPGGVSVAIAW